jgi:crossover junction endodeoxyribonuclease RusA
MERVERLEFWVTGTPIPQGSKTVFRGRAVESNPKLPAWRKNVTAAAVQALAGRFGFPKEAEIFTLLDFYMPRPKTVFRRRPNTRPDGDKLERAINDALTDARVWVDDGQIVSTDRRLWYADDRPGVRIVIGELA